MLREIDDLRNQERLAVAEYAVLKVCVCSPLNADASCAVSHTSSVAACGSSERAISCAQNTHTEAGLGRAPGGHSCHSGAKQALQPPQFCGPRYSVAPRVCTLVLAHARGACSDFRFINGFEVPESIMRFAHKPKSTACVMASLAVRRLVPALTVLLYVPRDAATQLKGLILKGRKYTQNRAADLVAARK